MSGDFSGFRTQEVTTVSAAARAGEQGAASIARDRVVLLLSLQGLVLAKVEALLRP